MKAWGVHLLVSCALLASAALAASCGGSSGDDVRAPFSAARADRLVELLHRGGNVLVLRHAKTDSAADMTDDFQDCSRQRNLSGSGRRQARTIGRALRRLGVRVEQSMASLFCRTRDTARLITGSEFTSRALLPPDLLDAVRKPGDYPGYSLRGQIAKYVDGASNVVFVSHQSTIAEALGLELQEGETAIVAPELSERGYRIVARLMPRDWAWLADR